MKKSSLNKRSTLITVAVSMLLITGFSSAVFSTTPVTALIGQLTTNVTCRQNIEAEHAQMTSTIKNQYAQSVKMLLQDCSSFFGFSCLELQNNIESAKTRIQTQADYDTWKNIRNTIQASMPNFQQQVVTLQGEYKTRDAQLKDRWLKNDCNTTTSINDADFNFNLGGIDTSSTIGTTDTSNNTNNGNNEVPANKPAQCPVVSCMAPEEGCLYEYNGTMNTQGCLKNPCGVMKCENKPREPKDSTILKPNNETTENKDSKYFTSLKRKGTKLIGTIDPKYTIIDKMYIHPKGPFIVTVIPESTEIADQKQIDYDLIGQIPNEIQVNIKECKDIYDCYKEPKVTETFTIKMASLYDENTMPEYVYVAKTAEGQVYGIIKNFEAIEMQNFEFGFELQKPNQSASYSKIAIPVCGYAGVNNSCISADGSFSVKPGGIQSSEIGQAYVSTYNGKQLYRKNYPMIVDDNNYNAEKNDEKTVQENETSMPTSTSKFEYGDLIVTSSAVNTDKTICIATAKDGKPFSLMPAIKYPVKYGMPLLVNAQDEAGKTTYRLRHMTPGDYVVYPGGTQVYSAGVVLCSPSRLNDVIQISINEQQAIRTNTIGLEDLQIKRYNVPGQTKTIQNGWLPDSWYKITGTLRHPELLNNSTYVILHTGQSNNYSVSIPLLDTSDPENRFTLHDDNTFTLWVMIHQRESGAELNNQYHLIHNVWNIMQIDLVENARYPSRSTLANYKKNDGSPNFVEVTYDDLYSRTFVDCVKPASCTIPETVFTDSDSPWPISPMIQDVEIKHEPGSYKATIEAVFTRGVALNDTTIEFIMPGKENAVMPRPKFPLWSTFSLSTMKIEKDTITITRTVDVAAINQANYNGSEVTQIQCPITLVLRGVNNEEYDRKTIECGSF